jgi:hypothetical protein
VRPEGEGYVLERRRQRVGAAGECSDSVDTISIDRVSVSALRAEASRAGLRLVEVHALPATAEHVPTEVVLFNGA